MYNFFYNFFKRPLANGLFNQDPEDGTPSPPISQFLLDNDSVLLTDNDGELLID